MRQELDYCPPVKPKRQGVKLRAAVESRFVGETSTPFMESMFKQYRDWKVCKKYETPKKAEMACRAMGSTQRRMFGRWEYRVVHLDD